MATTKKYVSLEKLSLYDEKIKKVISDGDAATLASAKTYVDDSIKTCDAAGAAATAKTEAIEAAKTETTTQVNALANGQVATNTGDIAKLKGDASTEGSVAKAVKDAQDALQANIDAVDDKADQNTADIETLEGKVAALEEGTYDDTEVRGLIGANADAIDALEEAHATDKNALEDAIALKADQTALDAVSGVANAAATKTALEEEVNRARGEEARIEGLVTAEAERAAGVESGLEGRIETMEAFWEAAKADGDEGNVIDTLKEIQDYIVGDETGASEMLAAINKNKDDIANHVATDHNFAAADATLKSELEAKIDAKADGSAVTELAGKVGELEAASATHALKSEVTAVSDALTEYKNAHTGDYTNAQIDEKIKVNADAIAALDDVYATDEALEAAISGEVSRADGAYAAKTLETTVSNHVADTVAHVTSEDKTKWNAALQASDIVAGSANGTISVKGTDVTVKGLGSAAFTEASAYDVAGAAAGVQTKLDEEVTRATNKEAELLAAINSFVECSEEDINGMFA